MKVTDFTGRKNYLNRTSLKEKVSSKWSNQAEKIVLAACQFV